MNQKLSTLVRDEPFVVAAFFLEWNASSHLLRSMLHDMQNRYHGKITLYFINAQHNSDLCSWYAVYRIPSVLFFLRGSLVDRFSGIPSRIQLEKSVAAIIRKTR